LRRFLFVAAALVAAVTAFITTTIPPKHLSLADPTPDRAIPGIIHVHSIRSDGRGTPDEIALAAAQAGLKFVVITDHGDGSRAPEPPAYRHGVLCLDAVEISTSGGHYIALDMAASPYPLGGEARDVVEDVKRLGGFGIVAHPDSPKDELRWRDWTAPFDAVEIVNLDTAWRQRAAGTSWRQKLGLAARLFSYPIRPAESIASLVQPSTIWERWATLATRRHLVTLPGADAHARVGWRTTGDPAAGGVSAPLPSYVASFQALSLHVRAERALTGNAGVDARMIIRAIRAGHAYSAIEGAASPSSFEFTATNEHGTVHEGDELSAAGPLTLHVRSNAPPGFTTTVWNGTAMVSGDHHEQDFSVQVPPQDNAGNAGNGVYRTEIRATGRFEALPWIISNPIYVRIPAPDTSVRPTASPLTTSLALFDGRSLAGWTVEQDATSLGAVEVVETGTTRQPALRWRFGLASGGLAGQFVALVSDLPHGAAPGDRVAFTARAERPMRLSVQLRTQHDRWQRSVYVDTFNRERTLSFDDFLPSSPVATGKPPLADVRSLLFVVDTMNTKPGASGRIWITEPRLQR
jgi:hypothetical protein